MIKYGSTNMLKSYLGKVNSVMTKWTINVFFNLNPWSNPNAEKGTSDSKTIKSTKLEYDYVCVCVDYAVVVE